VIFRGYTDILKIISNIDIIKMKEKIETLLSAEKSAQPETERWFNLDGLCRYYP
jgi:hypothetical protein